MIMRQPFGCLIIFYSKSILVTLFTRTIAPAGLLLSVENIPQALLTLNFSICLQVSVKA